MTSRRLTKILLILFLAACMSGFVSACKAEATTPATVVPGISTGRPASLEEHSRLRRRERSLPSKTYRVQVRFADSPLPAPSKISGVQACKPLCLPGNRSPRTLQKQWGAGSLPAALAELAGRTQTVLASWTNTGKEDHLVRHSPEQGATQFDSGTLGPGDSFSFSFIEAGSFPYTCSADGQMKGMVTVNP